MLNRFDLATSTPGIICQLDQPPKSATPKGAEQRANARARRPFGDGMRYESLAHLPVARQMRYDTLSDSSLPGPLISYRVCH